MKHLVLFILLFLTLITTGCDRGFQFASTKEIPPPPEAVVCNPVGAVLNVPSVVQRGQSFRMSYAYNDVSWSLTNLGFAQRFTGPEVTTSLNSLGQYVGQVDALDNCRNPVSEQFTITVVPPIEGLSIVINNNDLYTRNQAVNLRLAAAGATQMYITNVPNCSSGGVWESYNVSKNWTLGEINKSTQVYVKFKNAVIETPCISDDITHDNVAPNVRFVSVPQGSVSSRTATIDMAAEDTVSGVKNIFCKLNQQAFRVCSNREVFSNLSEGLNTVSMYAEDNAGNVSQTISSSWTVDTSRPSVRITRSPSNPSNLNSATFEFEGTDNGQSINTFRCSLDNAPLSNCQSGIVYNNLSDGSHTFKVVGYDQAGNFSDDAIYTWVIDTNAPRVLITQAPSSPTPDKVADFEFSVTEIGVGLQSVQCSLDGAALSNCTSPIQYSNLANGTHVFEVVARDLAGNIGRASHTWEVNDKIQIQPITIQDGIGNTDIVFLMEATSTMYSEYTNSIPDQFRNFLSRLTGVNYQIGVVTGDYRDGSSPYREGRLVPVENIFPYTYSLNVSTSNLATNFLETLSRKEVTCVQGTWSGPNGSFCGRSGWNLPVSSQLIRTGLRTIEHSDNQNFFRGNASLNIVVVSDSDEACSSGMFGSDGMCLPQDTEHRAETLVNSIRAKWPEKQFKAHSLVWRPQDSCGTRGGNAVGDTYHNLSQLTGGVSRSICNASSSEGNAIADAIKTSSLPVYQLRCVPRDMNNDGTPDVTVTYNPQPTSPITHVVNGSTISFTPNPPAGTVVTLRYVCP